MGKRHQIYIRVPEIDYGENNPNNRPERIIGFHHQWLYGATACEVLFNFLTFFEKHRENQEYNIFTSFRALEELDMLCQFILSYYPDNAGFEGMHDISDTACIENPHFGDNNDGITVIDISNINDPKYCFASLGFTNSSDLRMAEGAYCAKDYLSSYYKEAVWPEVQGRGGQDIVSTMARLEKYPVISFDQLKEIFPKWRENK